MLKIKPDFPIVELSSEQQNAVEICLDLSIRLACVTGGAGTGKTTILRNVHDELKANRKRVLLAAPTGRAAKRIQEATGIEAKTIHRLLEFPAPDEVSDSKGKLQFGKPKRNHNNPIPCDVLLLDEASMLNHEIYELVMDALPTHASLRLFGDINQLPPIESGNFNSKSVFAKLLDTKPSIYLTFNFRSDDNLIQSANRILQGRIPLRGDKFEMIITDDPAGAIRDVATRDYHSLNHQVITPKRVGKFGAIHISAMLRTKFNLEPYKPRLELQRWRPDDDDPITVIQDDKVIWTKNDYVLNIMNGELATLDAIDDGTLSLILDDNRNVNIPPSVRGPFGNMYDPRKSIDLAYCMTTHKAQGSEFDTIIYVICKSQAWMLDRNNFYTAVTRAKKKVIVISDSKALSYAMRKPKR